jgi:hypothetical protein
MLTHETNHRSPERRSITIPFYVAVSVVLFVCGMLIAGALVLSMTDNLEQSPRSVLTKWAINSGWDQTKDVRIRRALLKLPSRFLSSLGSAPDLPTLVIDIKFTHQEVLRKKRELALEQGLLIQEEGDLVPADIRTEGKQVQVKLRLKGDQPDHFDSDKWSMRVEVKGDDHILGMRRFSLQHPKVRRYQAEPIFMETLRHSGVLGIRYEFVHVIVNGVDKGIMALEEHFSKELLEHQARREGVFVRFDETNFWDYLRAGASWRSSPYDSFRNSRIRTFSAKTIEQSPALSAQYQAAVGMLRSFAYNQVTASEIFDVGATASYLAALELWGAWQSIQWNDMRFYLDPLTMRLEPIGYDAAMRLHSDIEALTLGREPIYTALLQDPMIRAEYARKLRELCRDVIDGELGAKLAEIQSDLLAVLRHEFLLLEPLDLGLLAERAQFLIELSDAELLEDPETYPRRIRYPALVQANLVEGPESQYLEMANYLPEPVTIKSIQWRDAESLAMTPAVSDAGSDFPFEIQPTVAGRIPGFVRLNLNDRPSELNRELVIIGNYTNWPQDKEIVAVPYFPLLAVNPVPKSTVEALLAAHQFLARDGSNNVIAIEPGRWTVESDMIVPPGFQLSAQPGTVLEFAPHAALISRGTLQFTGVEDNPVTLRGIGTEAWQGIAVLRAGDKSAFRHVNIENTTGVSRSAWEMAGGVNFYHSDVDFQDVSIRQHQGEDALNIVRSHFEIARLTIADAKYDAFDADFATGTIRESEFINIGPGAGGGDAIDISGSEVVVDDVTFQRIGDKALSVGEASRMVASNVLIKSAGTAAASKDGSHLDLTGMVIDEVSFAGLMAYIKKPEYGPASIKAKNVVYKGTGPVGRAQTGSEIELDGESLPSEDLDVDLLYETVMRKGT